MAALGWLLNLGFAGSGASEAAGGASYDTRVEEPQRVWTTRWRRPQDRWRQWSRLLRPDYERT